MSRSLISRWAGVLLGMIVSAQMPVAAAAADALAVVVAAERPLDPIGADILALVYLKKKERWADGHRIQPVNLSADDPLRQQFSMAVLHQPPAALDDYWNEQYFHGISPPHVVLSERAMARFVEMTEGAIGYLRYCGLSATLRVLLVVTPEGRLLAPGEASGLCAAKGE